MMLLSRPISLYMTWVMKRCFVRSFLSSGVMCTTRLPAFAASIWITTMHTCVWWVLRLSKKPPARCTSTALVVCGDIVS